MMRARTVELCNWQEVRLSSLFSWQAVEALRIASSQHAIALTADTV